MKKITQHFILALFIFAIGVFAIYSNYKTQRELKDLKVEYKILKSNSDSLIYELMVLDSTLNDMLKEYSDSTLVIK